MTDLLAVKTGLLETLRLQNQCALEDLMVALDCDQEGVIRAMTALREHGYQIEETQEQYQLKFAPDIPFPFEFPGRQDRVHYFPQITSTMDEARKRASQGCPDLTVIISDVQTKGRGRMDRTWASEEGGLYFTFVIKPTGPPAEAIKFNFIASLALVVVLREECHIDARVKWPNDIMVGDGKLSGMLSEMDVSGDVIKFVNIGIGINVNNDPSLIEPRAVSIRALTGRSFSRTKILGLFLDRFEAGLDRADFADVIKQWKKYAGCLNREITIVTRKETLRGFAETVDEHGALVLRLADGTTRAVCYGDCFYG